MTDFHSHVLPGIDDGSKNTEESIMMLKLLGEQGIDLVAATPHFYANAESTESFLRKRKRAYDELCVHLTPELPEIILGAEVRYYPGISRMPELSSLTYGESKLLLLEMPMAKWTEMTVRELEELSCSGRVIVLLAHVERYMGFQSEETMDRIRNAGILLQVNASFINRLSTRHKAIKMLRDGKIHFIGSDSHNTTTRAPQMDKALEIVKKRLGEQFPNRMNEMASSLLTLK